MKKVSPVKILNQFVLLVGAFLLSFNASAQNGVEYDKIDGASLEELLLLSVNDTVKEVYVIENSMGGLEDLSFEALLKVGIQESKIEQRSLSMEELSELPIDDLINIDASMNSEQGVKVVELDISDLNLEELMALDAVTKSHVQIKKVK